MLNRGDEYNHRYLIHELSIGGLEASHYASSGESESSAFNARSGASQWTYDTEM